MQLSDSKQLIDCVSAQELLQALNTLQQMNEQTANQFELSFSQSSHSYFNTACNKGQMDFELYMAIKNNKKNQEHNPKKIRNRNSQDNNKIKNVEARFNKKIIKQNVMPNKQMNLIKEKKNQKSNLSLRKQKSSDIKEFKSRSHSPIQTKRKVPKENCSSSTIAFVSMFKSKKNKQTQAQPQQIKNSTPIKINEQSKKIMVEREKQGKTYVPIYNRTKQLIKQKQQKIAKLQRNNLTQIQLQERECTFKPTINSSKKWIKNKENNCVKNRHRAHTAMNSIGQDSMILKQAHNEIEDCLENRHSIENITKKDKLEGSKVEKNAQKAVEKCQPTKRKQKPKNSKFNILLDLIH